MPRRERRRSDHPNGNLNRILASLPASEMRRVERDLEPYELDSRAVLQDVDAPIRDVFFVETGVISVLAATVDGAAVEVATVGREGFVGLPVALGTDRAASQSVVQIPGAALRMPAAAFRRHFEAGGELQNLVHRYAQAMFTMLAQSSACNRLHSVYQRCARWLLTTRDRVGSPSFPLTHEFLAQMIGVRRASVSVVLGDLKRDGLVNARRGGISIVSPRGLEQQSCECYAIINDEFDRLLDGKRSSQVLARVRRRASRPRGSHRPPIGTTTPPRRSQN